MADRYLQSITHISGLPTIYYVEPEQASISYQVARANSLPALGRHQEALDVYDHLLQADPQNKQISHAKALLLYDMRNYRECIRVCLETLNMTCMDLPHFNEAINKLIEMCLISMGAPISALGAWETQALVWSHEASEFAMVTGSIKAALWCTEIALKLDPQCSHAWIHQGQFLYDLGRYEEALVSLRQSVMTRQNDPLSRVLFHNSKFDQVARDFINRCQIILDIPIQSLLDEATQAKKNDQNEEAERLFRQALEECPNSAKARLGLGVALMDQGALEASIEQFDRGIEQDPTLALLWFNRGLALFRSSSLDNEKALASFTRALELDENHYRSQNMVGECLRLQGRYDEAKCAFERSLTLNPESGVALGALATLLTDLGQPEEALPYIDKGVKLYPGSAAHWEVRGNVLAALGRYQESCRCHLQAMTLNPNLVSRLSQKIQNQEQFQQPSREPLPGEKYTASDYNLRGITYKKQGRYAEALADLDQVIELDPSFAAAYNNRGNVYNKLQRHEAALADFNHSIALNPTNALAYNNRGINYSDMQLNKRALADFKKAIELDPLYATAYFNIGKLLIRSILSSRKKSI